MRTVAGVILAGGRSSRMGQNKVLMSYQGKRLVDIMADRLRGAGIRDIIVSGHVEEYRCLEDKVSGGGPARAILDMAGDLQSYDGALFVPVDIPLIQPRQLKTLAAQKDGAFYAEHFLPACIPVQKLLSLNPAVFEEQNLSVWRFLAALDIPSLPVVHEDEPYFLNVNTPEEYRKLANV